MVIQPKTNRQHPRGRIAHPQALKRGALRTTPKHSDIAVLVTWTTMPSWRPAIRARHGPAALRPRRVLRALRRTALGARGARRRANGSAQPDRLGAVDPEV